MRISDWSSDVCSSDLPIRSDGPQSHLAKRGTPTMGGLMILTSLTLSTLLWMDLNNPYVWACLCVTLGFGAIGFLDDYDKVRKGISTGVSGKLRLLGEFARSEDQTSELQSLMLYTYSSFS